jgi:hypothetical protein
MLWLLCGEPYPDEAAHGVRAHVAGHKHVTTTSRYVHANRRAAGRVLDAHHRIPVTGPESGIVKGAKVTFQPISSNVGQIFAAGAETRAHQTRQELRIVREPQSAVRRCRQSSGGHRSSEAPPSIQGAVRTGAWGVGRRRPKRVLPPRHMVDAGVPWGALWAWPVGHTKPSRSSVGCPAGAGAPGCGARRRLAAASRDKRALGGELHCAGCLHGHSGAHRTLTRGVG